MEICIIFHCSKFYFPICAHIFPSFADLIFKTSSVGMSILAFIIAIAILGAFLGQMECLLICIWLSGSDMYSTNRKEFLEFIFGSIFFGGLIFCLYYNISAIVNENEEWRKKRDLTLMIIYEAILLIIGLLCGCINCRSTDD